VRILAVADEVHPALYDHLDLSRFKGIDAIISCGDLPDSYLDFLASSFNVPCFYVRGNHDPGAAPAGWENLDDRLVVFQGLRIAGFEGCRLYTNHPVVQYTEREMWWKVRRLTPRIWLKGGVDVVVTHAPPKGLHEGGDLAHQGLASFRWLMEKYQPRLFLHGHQHLNYAAFQERVTQVGPTRLINAFGYHIVEV
jgi:Icc-related predicted phosphoesterase